MKKETLDIDAIVGEAVPMRPNPQLAFTAPIRVDSETNKRDHPVAKWRRGKKQKETLFIAWLEAIANGQARQVSLPCVVRLTRVGQKALDSDDNLREAFKTLKDAIARELCGGVNRMGVDDGDERITWEYAQVPVGRRVYQVRVEIY